MQQAGNQPTRTTLAPVLMSTVAFEFELLSLSVADRAIPAGFPATM
jgi:hypothetical protein